MRGTEEEEIERKQLQTIKIKENEEIKGEERRLTRTKKRKWESGLKKVVPQMASREED